MCVNKFMQTSEHFNLNDQKFFHRIIHVYVSIRLFEYIFIQLYGSMLCIPNKTIFKIGTHRSGQEW